jgi:proteasome lid subunit RPN8/RPN11
MSARIVFTGSQNGRLRTWLEGHPEGHERAALALFRKLDRSVAGLEASPRYVCVDVLELKGDWILSSSETHVRINMRLLPEVYLRCEVEHLELGFVHSHPAGAHAFSAIDDQNEQNLLRGFAGCNGTAVTLVALVLCEGRWHARTRSGATPRAAMPARHVAVLSDSIELHLGSGAGVEENVASLARQETAFGKPFNRKLQSLRAVVIGAGGTGSALVTLLARCGIGELIVVDGDKLETSNLNRVRGYRVADVDQNKADTLARYIANLGLSCKVTSIAEFVDRSPVAVDAISSADIVFGCTDDVGGRDVLTQAMYYYCLPYIDVGLTGRIDHNKEGDPYLRDHRGRISVIAPESGACLRCQRVVTEEKLAFERAMRARPELKKIDKETLLREYYLKGGGEAAPGVGPFTSMVADFAVSTFMNLVKGYRRLSEEFSADNVWIDFVHLNFSSIKNIRRPDCFCCGKSGLLNASENGYRLGIASLGKLPTP